MPKSSWTSVELDYLKKLCEDGLSSSKIAAAFGDRSRNAIIGKLHRMGLNLKHKVKPPPRPRRVPVLVIKPPLPKKPLEPPAEPQKWSGAPIPMLDAGHGQCRAIIDPDGDPRGLATVCGDRTSDGSSYSFCDYHLHVYTRPRSS